MIKKQFLAIFLLFILTLSFFTSCGSDESKNGELTITDADGKVFGIPKAPRVVCAYGSFAECWLLSGGKLVGTTDDAVSERRLELSEDTVIVGSVKSIDIERVISLRPDLVILSADLTAHRSLALQLADLGIAAALFRVDSFSDYDAMMKQFCAVNGGDSLYTKHVTEVKNGIDRIRSAIPESAPKREILVMRAYSGGIKVKTDNLAEDIACELGCVSLAREYPSMLTSLSVEAIIASDPDMIFVLTMGDETEATEYMKNYFYGNPALSSLTAVKNERLYLLPKELFHYKPNNKWNESYEYLAKIIYPEIFG